MLGAISLILTTVKLVLPPGIEPGSTVAHYLVGGLGIEPNSTALQAVAEITRLAHPPKNFSYCSFSIITIFLSGYV